MKIGKNEFDFSKRTYIMGILNLTPDSFSDGGRYPKEADVLRVVDQMVAEGVDIIDIGGESTRPNYTPVSVEEELSRIIPIIDSIKKHTTIPLSVDTYKAPVAKAALAHGVDFINDIWGFKADPQMAKLCSEYQVPCCLMHNRGKVPYENLIEDVLLDLQESIDIALNAGVSPNKIMIDPGIGFAKTYEENIELLKNLEQLKRLGYPILLGTSRKGMIGRIMGRQVTERDEGTAATTVLGIQKGCSMVRVHNVEMNQRVAVVADKFYR